MELVLEGNSEELKVRVIGEIVAAGCNNLRTTVMESASKEPDSVVINLNEVPFIDTSGIGVLVGLRAHLKSKQIDLKLEAPSEKVKEVLKMTRLLSVFGLSDD